MAVRPSTTRRSPAKTGISNVADVSRIADSLVAAIETVIDGKPEICRTAVTVLLAEGHLLIEDVPGVGKTMLAKALAKAVGASVTRIQFTPDLLPSDITGVSVFDPESREFVFKPGAIFSNIVVGDEINRASPKTQSALLECMEERQVSVDGQTYHLAMPFLVVATQNPIEMEGTFPLPEAQRDRFMARLSMGYPSADAELEMLEGHASGDPLDDLRAVTDAGQMEALIDVVRQVHVSEEVYRYAIAIVDATRRHPDLRLGASPRATLHLIRAAKAVAALDNRDYVLPDDIQSLASTVLAHRVLPTPDALISGREPVQVVSDILAKIPVRDGAAPGRPRRRA